MCVFLCVEADEYLNGMQVDVKIYVFIYFAEVLKLFLA